MTSSWLDLSDRSEDWETSSYELWSESWSIWLKWNDMIWNVKMYYSCFINHRHTASGPVRLATPTLDLKSGAHHALPRSDTPLCVHARALSFDSPPFCVRPAPPKRRRINSSAQSSHDRPRRAERIHRGSERIYRRKNQPRVSPTVALVPDQGRFL